MADDVCIHIHTCNRCLRFKQPQERAEMQLILVSYPMELVHLDFLTLGEKAGDNKSVNILIGKDHFTKYAQDICNTKNRQQWWLLEPCGRIFWYIMGGLRRSSLTKGSPLRTT